MFINEHIGKPPNRIAIWPDDVCAGTLWGGSLETRLHHRNIRQAGTIHGGARPDPRSQNGRHLSGTRRPQARPFWSADHGLSWANQRPRSCTPGRVRLRRRALCSRALGCRWLCHRYGAGGFGFCRSGRDWSFPVAGTSAGTASMCIHGV